MKILESSTVAEVAAASPAAPGVLERYGIEYCCGGGIRSFEDACREKGLSAAAICEELDRAAATESPSRDWNQASLRDLIRHIVTTHHEYLKLELPRLGQRIAKVVNAHSEHDPVMLGELQTVYRSLWEELDLHMHKEELMLFPAIERYEAAAGAGAPLPPFPFGTIGNPIAVMEQEHDSAGNALRRIRELTGDYHAPAYACATYHAMLEGLQFLESDLHQHIHLENNILFPRVIALESGRPGAWR